MEHSREFDEKPEPAVSARKAKLEQLAACYARTFLENEDGKRIFANLNLKFPADAIRFAEGRSTHMAAFIDGQASVLTEINRAIDLGRTTTPASTT
jgi:hypothetical protein